MRIAIFNDQGRVDTAINDSTLTALPEGAVELSEEQWNDRFNLLLVDGELTTVQFVLSEPLEDVIARRLSTINRECERAVSQITATYPASEVLSWPKQETEARLYANNMVADTPLLSALATARGIPLAELASRVILKADAFAQVSGTLIGKRQQLEDMLNALPIDATAEDVLDIQWE
ncbi:MAG TPA: hypothetical protein VK974_00615 [Methylophilaceae bacterium]|nr:hypothetical protein [Methylophilaceae bacterium]